MEQQFWRNKWLESELGFNQPRPHPSLDKLFPKLHHGARVLVPLCGKSIDMLWLEEQGYAVTGVELVEEAVMAFFKEQQIAYNKQQAGPLVAYQAVDRHILIYAGDFFAFNAEPFDALYDRAALVAFPPSMRADYTNHCIGLLKDGAHVHLVSFDYDTSVKDGPPFSIPETDVKLLWGNRLNLISSFDMLSVDSPFKEGGFQHFNELVFQAHCQTVHKGGLNE